MDDQLFDTMPFYGKPMVKAASVRNAIGDVAEEFACAALSMKRQRVDGRKNVCCDALDMYDKPVEIKSVGKNNRALLYKWRAEKEEKEHGLGYTYVFVRHSCPITMTHGREIIQRFIDCPPLIIITTLGALRAALEGVSPRTFKMFTGEAGAVEPEGGFESSVPQHMQKPIFDRKTMHGSQRKGYVDGGWQFSLSLLSPTETKEVDFQWCNHVVKATVITATFARCAK
jgi:hypothetical protein